MSLDALRESLPEYAKDLSLNLSSLASETTLNDQQKWGCFVACAYAVGSAPVSHTPSATTRICARLSFRCCTKAKRSRIANWGNRSASNSGGWRIRKPCAATCATTAARPTRGAALT